MSEHDRDHDELRRRLADQGQARAPGDLASEVMRRVHAEPRRSPRPVLVPLVAALLAAAALVGVSRLDGGGTAGSGAGTAAAGSTAQPRSTEKAAAPSIAGVTAQKGVIRGVAVRRAEAILGLTAPCPAADSLWASVPNALYDGVLSDLKRAAGANSGASPRIDVHLRHAPKAQTRIRVTCP